MNWTQLGKAQARLRPRLDATHALGSPVPQLIGGHSRPACPFARSFVRSLPVEPVRASPSRAAKLASQLADWQFV